MISGLIALLLYIVVIGVVLWLALYIMNTLPMAEPFRQVGRTVIVVIGALILILLLMNFIGIVDSGIPRLR